MVYKGKVLLADDEENFQQAIAVLLREQGYLCDVVSGASAATERLHHNRYDVLIDDIKMPGNTELEFIRDLSPLPDPFSWGNSASLFRTSAIP